MFERVIEIVLPGLDRGIYYVNHDNIIECEKSV